MSVEEAVARFFPAGTSYDYSQAQRLIQWLDHCGYAVVPKEQAKVKAQKSAPRALKAA